MQRAAAADRHATARTLGRYSQGALCCKLTIGCYVEKGTRGLYPSGYAPRQNGRGHTIQ